MVTTGRNGIGWQQKGPGQLWLLLKRVCKSESKISVMRAAHISPEDQIFYLTVARKWSDLFIFNSPESLTQQKAGTWLEVKPQEFASILQPASVACSCFRFDWREDEAVFLASCMQDVHSTDKMWNKMQRESTGEFSVLENVHFSFFLLQLKHGAVRLITVRFNAPPSWHYFLENVFLLNSSFGYISRKRLLRERRQRLSTQVREGNRHDR